MFDFNTVISKEKALQMNSVVLAFIGDAVYSLFVREKLSLFCDCKTGELSKRTTAYVRASAQADMITKLLPTLSEEELYVFKRARNSYKSARAKSATVSEYNKSTGFEALLGFLHLTGQKERLNEILNFGENDED